MSAIEHILGGLALIVIGAWWMLYWSLDATSASPAENRQAFVLGDLALLLLGIVPMAVGVKLLLWL